MFVRGSGVVVWGCRQVGIWVYRPMVVSITGEVRLQVQKVPISREFHQKISVI